MPSMITKPQKIEEEESEEFELEGETKSEFEEKKLENCLFRYFEDKSQNFYYHQNRVKVSIRDVDDNSAVTHNNNYKQGNEGCSDNESEETYEFLFNDVEIF
ncbi:11890_t:CDS:2 [Dentiscutata heterogama]|uniref:11890_t:CDS:1 n=1 Tax=Dentiscutata heterogama TaxID=1316150 RepID=A0ACA9MWB0_9GLOM|nr:11890_t:CDS:2 [Dentiscutata heterogama]